CKWWPLFTIASKPLEPEASAFSDEEIYNMLTDDDEFGLIYDDPPRPNALSVVGTYVHYQVYGPYTLNPGDKAKIVMAYVGGSGADYLANQGVYNPRLAPENEWARSLDPQKFEQYKLGEQSLFYNLSLAKEIYDLGYDVPDPPPDVLIQDLYHNANGHLQIFWSDEASNAEDPDYSGEEAKDVAGYRIYRMKIGGAAEKADPDDPRHDDKLSADWHNGPYELMDSILVGETESSWRKIITWDPERKLYRCSDGETKVGAFDYFYSVRSFDTGHDDWNGTGIAIPSLESGFSAPEQRMNTGYQPGYIVNEETDNFEKQVRVVPNPYKRDGLHEYSNTIEIKFFNIPQKCVISIFSVSGDLVSREYHDQASPIGSWDQQTIKFAGDIAPGIYFWVVESKVEGEYEYVTTEGDTLPPVYVNSKGQIQKGTLLIIREQ
ncbi:hypothetical protein KA005_60255, partial [bacterium]|nr:hypothetical protein [bacterium]